MKIVITLVPAPHRNTDAGSHPVYIHSAPGFFVDFIFRGVGYFAWSSPLFGDGSCGAGGKRVLPMMHLLKLPGQHWTKSKQAGIGGTPF